MKRVKAFAVTFFLFCILVPGISAQDKKFEKYTVKRGDTLGEIRFDLKVQGVDTTRLNEWNPSLGTQVAEGQMIYYELPDSDRKALRSAAEKLENSVIKLETANRDKPAEPAGRADTNWLPYVIFPAILLISSYLILARKKVRNSVPIDPAWDQIKNSKFPMRIIITLAQENVRIPCKVEKNSQGKGVVFFEGRNEPVSWEKRKSKAAEIYADRHSKEALA